MNPSTPEPAREPGRERARWCLRLACDSARGQLAALTALLDRHGAYIEELAVHDDRACRRFFVRSVFRLDDAAPATLQRLHDDWAALLPTLGGAEGSLHDLRRPARVLVLVSRADHCLRELLAQWRRRELAMDLVAVASNHRDLEPLAAAEGLPFHHLPITPQTKPQQEAALQDCIAAHGAEIVVLARYMQVLSPALCERLAGRVINIHHSFLPGFKGARPYEQAHARGVKLIGATAHFATPDLDEGPIIEQAVERVDHADDAAELMRVGRHVESLVLGRALRCLLEHRVFVNGLRTVVLR